MYDVERKKRLAVVFIIGCLLGNIIFLLIYGYNVLNVTYDDWLLSGGDLSQHYFGWIYYRKTPWQFPIGMIEGFGDSIKTSIIYMDSIPIMAIIFKPFRNILPHTFQYFGIWGLVSFGLMGGLSSILISKFTNNKIFCWLGSIFFIISPYVLQRMFSHTSLGGQWIIILALIIWFFDMYDKDIIRKTLVWSGILCLATLIHLYFVPMIVIFILADAIKIAIKDKRILKSFFVFFIPILMALLILFCFGAFQNSDGLSSDGLGYYSSNLNSFLNPIFGISTFLKQLPNGGGQYEGMGYLGVGGILLLFSATTSVLLDKNEITKMIKENKVKICLSIGCILALLILAISPTITLNSRTIVTIPWPDFIIKVLSIFRSSGRFIWPICYIVFFFSMFLLNVRKPNYKTNLLLMVLCCIQMIDLKPLIAEKHIKFDQTIEYNNLLNEVTWNNICEGKNKFVIVPYDYVYRNAEKIFSLGKIAYNNDMTFSSFYVSRPDIDKLEENQEEWLKELEEGKSREDVIYIFESIDDIWQESYKLDYYKIDNILVGISGINSKFYNEEELQSVNANHNLVVDLEDMRLTDSTQGDSEDFNIQEGQIMYGPYYKAKKGNYNCVIRGKNLENLTFEIASFTNNMTYENQIEYVSTDLVNISFYLPTDITDLEIKAYNDKNTSLVEKITLEYKNDLKSTK